MAPKISSFGSISIFLMWVFYVSRDMVKNKTMHAICNVLFHCWEKRFIFDMIATHHEYAFIFCGFNHQNFDFKQNKHLIQNRHTNPHRIVYLISKSKCRHIMTCGGGVQAELMQNKKQPTYWGIRAFMTNKNISLEFIFPRIIWKKWKPTKFANFWVFYEFLGISS
jgi:hypothetical protein